MNKTEFIRKLSSELRKRITKEEVEDAIKYYIELINDRLDLGEIEKDIIASLGSIDQIVRSMSIESLEKRPATKNVKDLYESSKDLLRLATTPILLLIGFIFAVIMFSLGIALISIFVAFGFSLIAIGISIVDSIGLVITMESSIFVGLFIVGIHVFIFGIFLSIMIAVKDILYYFSNNAISIFTRLLKKKVV